MTELILYIKFIVFRYCRKLVQYKLYLTLISFFNFQLLHWNFKIFENLIRIFRWNFPPFHIWLNKTQTEIKLVGLSWICLNWNVRAPCMNKPFILYAVFSNDLKLKNLFAPLQCFQDVFAIPQEWLYQFSNIENRLLNNLQASKIERKNFWTHFL